MSRPRRDPGRAYVVTLEVLNASLTLDMWVEHWGTEEEGRRAWEALRSRLVGNPGRRRAPFWAYTSGVPAELRGSGTIDDSENRELQARRLRWLLGPGKAHQRPGEARILYDRIGELEAEIET